MTPRKHRTSGNDDRARSAPSGSTKRDDVGDQSGGKSTGGGNEAARGIHGANKHGSPKRPGSEPLQDRDSEHESGYGGRGGVPRTSSDERGRGR